MDGTTFSAPGVTTMMLPEGSPLLHDHIEPMLHRELTHRWVVPDGSGFRAELIRWVEVTA